MYIYFGTVIRNAPINSGGELIALDWESKTVMGKVAIFPSEPDLSHDSNPRGNGRGCRGITIYKDSIVAANYHSLSFFDYKLNPRRTLTHGLMAGLHELNLNDDNSIWVTSTALDSVLRYDLASGDLKQSFWPRDMAQLQDQLGLVEFPVDRKADNRERYLNRNVKDDTSHLHLNAVATWEGEVYCLFNSHGVIANLSTGEVILRNDGLRGAHNLVINSEGIAFSNDTLGRAVMLFDLKKRSMIDRIDILKFAWVRSLARKSRRIAGIKSVLHRVGLVSAPPGRELFLRGLVVDNDRIYLGLSPASIIEINWRTKRFSDGYQYSANVNHCVHGLCLAATQK